jgi:D-lactate dehydrogenase (cytochrome)
MLRVHPGETFAITDVSVPISEYPVIAEFANGLIQEMGLKGALFGHAGDGNLHTTLFCDPQDAAGVAAMEAFNDRVVNEAIRLGGTCTGEHGVGIGKQKYMIREHGAQAYGVMKQIKDLFDPGNILNPGKVVGYDV